MNNCEPIDLSRNESFIKRKIKVDSDSNLYPNVSELRNALAAKHNVQPDQIIIGNGSSEILNIASKIAAEFTKEVQVDKHTYGPMKDTIRRNGCYTSLANGSNVRFIVNPDNPTGKYRIPECYLNHVGKNIYDLLVVDEAYLDFVPQRKSFSDFVSKMDGILVTKTFSKLKGLAGIRVGYGICSWNIAHRARKLEKPYSISSHSIEAAISALDDDCYEVEYLEKNRRSLNILSTGLLNLGVETYPHSANFVAAKIPEVPGFLLRDLTHYSLLPGWKRITTHEPGIMHLFLKKLEEELEKQK